jgi:hypothetical protein
MPQPPEITSPSLPANPAEQPGVRLVSADDVPLRSTPGLARETHEPGFGSEPHRGHRPPRWLEETEVFLRLAIQICLGLFFLYAPWISYLPDSSPLRAVILLHKLWDQNPLLLHFPTLSMIAANGAVRGIASGLGLLNVWIAFQTAIRHGTGKP